ncbi:Variable large protein A62 silD (plasmid) [Borrelia hermsii]|uniref:Variable large protein n=2 Tax=Borrelia hermsii TaxID=140 RepID=Q1CNX7_BORHD|nr:variable large family protein [Borrelia hermsii]ABF82184.1 VlpA62silD [Borrelia hermsii DAH]AMR76053.1 Variable large protein A62 silD [Borrelia hermsii]UPA08380.1 variable large family protein [Borrelia hermsii DAH]
MRKRISAIINKLNISIMMMIVVLMIGCGQQAVEAGKDGVAAATGGRSLSEVLMDVGRSAENVFYSFLELVSDTLGFTAKATTKKEDVGGYFSSLGDKIGKASEELEQVAKKSEVEGAKDGPISVAIRSAVNAAKTTLSTLKGHLDSLKDIGDTNPVSWTASNAAGAKAKEDVLKKALKALQGILDIAKAVGVSEPKAGTTAVKINNLDNKDGVKILATDNTPGATDSDKASLIVSAVSGEEILASIVNSQEGHVKAVAEDVKAETTPLEFAVGGTANHLAKETAKAAAVAGGMALRSLVKDGKLASNNNDNDKAVQAVGIDATNKLLGAVEDLIKKTVKNVLEKAKEKIDKARAPKATGQ